MKIAIRLKRLVPAARRVAVVYRVELTKAIRQRQTYVGPLLLALVVLLSTLAQPLSKDDVGDYDFIAYVTPLALNFLGFVLLLSYVGGLFATELGRGTLRALLLRPVYREEVYVAKFLIGCSYSVVLTATVAIMSWVTTIVFGDLYGIQVGGELLYTTDDMVRAYFAGALLALAPQWAGVALGLLFSSLTRHASTAVSLSIGTWIVLDLVKYPLGIAPLVYTTYLETPWHVFTSRCDGLEGYWMPETAYCLASSIVVIVLALATGMVLFARRNLGTC